MLAAKKILIIEDDATLARGLRHKFERHGIRAEECHDGQEALKRLNHEHFDFILEDLMMPIKDGFAVLQEKPATLNRATPVCVLTALGQDDKLERARSLGAWRCYVKSETSADEVVKDIQKELEATH